MRTTLMAGLTAGVLAWVELLPVAAQPPEPTMPTSSGVRGQPDGTPGTSDGKAPGDTPAAAFTRGQALKARVSVDFNDAPLGEILKELAHLVEVQTDRPLMWRYGPGFPYKQRVSFAVTGQPLEVALDQLFSKAGGGLGYVVVSRAGDKYDGWILLTTTGERGSVRPAASEEEEAEAAEKLALAKKLIDAGRGAMSQPVLELILRKYPTTKAAAEAKTLLSQIRKDP